MTTHSHRLSTADLWLLAALTLIWGVNWPIMKIGVTEMPPLMFRAGSMLIGLPLLAVVIRWRGMSLYVAPEHRSELFWLAISNLTIWLIVGVYGIQMLSSGRAAILGYTMPVWSALVGALIYRERSSMRLQVGVLAAAIGVCLLMASEFGVITGSPIGVGLMLIAALSWAVGTHLMRRRRLPTSLLVIMFWSLAISLAVCLPLALLFEVAPGSLPSDSGAWFAMFYNGILVFAFAQLIWFRLATILPPVASGLSVMLIPVVGVFSGVGLLGESLGWTDGAALISLLVAIGTVLWPARAPRAPRSLPENREISHEARRLSESAADERSAK